MAKPRLLFLSLGGTITMVPSAAGGIAPKLGAAELVASVPELADVARDRGAVAVPPAEPVAHDRRTSSRSRRRSSRASPPASTARW